MNEPRTLLIAAAASLARLQVRLLQLSMTQRRLPGGNIAKDAHWAVCDLDPPSEWLDACPPRTSLSGALSAVALALAHLLAMIDAEQPIDPRLACVVLQHVSLGGSRWSSPVSRLAARLNVSLANSPMEETHGVWLHGRPLPRRQREIPL